MDEGVRTLRGEDLREASLGRGLREIDLVEAGLALRRLGRLDVDRDDTRDAFVFFEEPNEVRAEERGRSCHCDDTPTGLT